MHHSKRCSDTVCVRFASWLVLGAAMAWTAAAFAAGSSTDKAPAELKRIALVIGNGSYLDAPLANAKNDALAMCEKLKALGFETSCSTDLRTKRDMRAEVRGFAGRLNELKGKGGAAALVYYAGHALEVGGKNYLMPTGADIESEVDVEDEALSVDYVLEQLDVAQNPFNIIILDACRNNPLSRGFRSVGTSGGLAPLKAPSGTVILYATAPGEVAADGKGDNGLFTKHLLANIDKKGMALEEMFKEVSRGVTAESQRTLGKKQTPWWNSSFDGNFCFAGCSVVDERERERFERDRAALEAEQQRTRQQAAELARKDQELRSREAEAKAAADERNKNRRTGKGAGYVPPAL